MLKKTKLSQQTINAISLAVKVWTANSCMYDQHIWVRTLYLEAASQKGYLWACDSVGALVIFLKRPIVEALTYFPSWMRNVYLEKILETVFTIFNYINAILTTFGKCFLFYILPLMHLSLNLLTFIFYKFFLCFPYQSKLTGSEIFHCVKQSMVGYMEKGYAYLWKKWIWVM